MNKPREYREYWVSQKCGYMSRYQTPNASIPGFHTVWANRDTTVSSNKKGGGLAVRVNNRWCHPRPISPKEHVCCQDIELTAIRLQTKYPGALIIITGDFNHFSLSSTLPMFCHFVHINVLLTQFFYVFIDLLCANLIKQVHLPMLFVRNRQH